MPAFKFPKLDLSQWNDTRNSIQLIVKIMGEVRVLYTQKQKHWYHVNIRPSIHGFSTTLLHQHHNTIFELEYNFNLHELIIADNLGNKIGISPKRKSIANFTNEVIHAVSKIAGVAPKISDDILNNTSEFIYNDAQATDFFNAFLQISIVLKAFKHTLKEETSEVQLWPDHFDLALLWFSGREVKGVDPNDEEKRDEQMNFGFSTGDETISEAYFYATAYPMPENMKNIKVPAPLYWYEARFKGFIIKYNDLIEAIDPAQLLYNCLGMVQKETSKLMTN